MVSGRYRLHIVFVDYDYVHVFLSHLPALFTVSNLCVLFM